MVSKDYLDRMARFGALASSSRFFPLKRSRFRGVPEEPTKVRMISRFNFAAYWVTIIPGRSCRGSTWAWILTWLGVLGISNRCWAINGSEMETLPKNRLSVLVTYQLLGGFCLPGPRSTLTPIRSNLEATDGKKANHYTSSNEFLQRHYLYGGIDATFEFNCQLVFAARDWTTCYVETKDHAVMLFCTSSQSNLLQTLPVGSTLRIKGHSSADAGSLSMDSFELLDRYSELKPLDLTTVNQDSSAKLNGLVSIRTRVRELMLDSDCLYLFTWFGYIPHEIEIHDATVDEFHARSLWNKVIHANGSLTRTNSYFLDALFTIRSMNKEQILEPKLSEATPEPYAKFAEFSGQVLYSDSRDSLLVWIDENVRSVKSRFAHRLKAGDCLTIYVSQNNGQAIQPPDRLAAAIVVRQETQQLPLPVTIAPEQLRVAAYGSMPSRIQIAATVLHLQHRADKNWLLKLDCGGVLVDAIVPTSETLTNIEGFRPSDQVIVTAVPYPSSATNSKIAARNEANSTEPPFVIYLSNVDDLRFVRGRLRISPWTLIYAGLITAALLLLAVFWNWLLRQQVAVRTQRLNAVSTHLRKSYEAIPKAVLVHGVDNRTSGFNSNFESLFGLNPREGEDAAVVLGKLEGKVADQASFRDFLQRAFSEPSRAVHARLQLTKGDVFIDAFSSSIVDRFGKSFGRLWTFDDVTEKLRMENELAQAKKMAMVEQLSGGIAHDFNNLLTIIRSSLTMIGISLERGKPIGAFTNAAEVSVDRAAELTQQLLDFSRRSSLKRQSIDVNALLKQVHGLVRQSIDKSVDFQVHVLTNPIYVEIDENRLEQILINICLNARDAIEHSHGRIVLQAVLNRKPRPPHSVRIIVKDNGSGMTEDVCQRIFEPFFTTKQIGKGTGLGLAMAQSVIEQLGGSIACRSEVGQGTEFAIDLPSTPPPRPDRVGAVATFSRPTAGLKVLLVDDEELVRNTGSAMLESMGHEVTTAENGSDAIELLTTECGFDAVLLDFGMPGLNGWETYRQIKELHPKLLVTICSGYCDDLEKQFANDVVPTLPHFLRKPYRMEDIHLLLQETRHSG